MLTWLKEKFKSKSSQPWAEFETPGLDDQGRIKWIMRWNNAFIDSLRKSGFGGMTEEETVQQFFMMCQMMPDGMQPNETVNPTSMPNLSNEANSFRR